MDRSVRRVLASNGLWFFILVQVTVTLLAPTYFFTPTYQVGPLAAAVADVRTTLDVALDRWVLGYSHGDGASTCCWWHHRRCLGSYHHGWLLHGHRWLLHHHWLHLANRVAHVLLLLITKHLLLCHVNITIRLLINRDSHSDIILIAFLFPLCHFKFHIIISYQQLDF